MKKKTFDAVAFTRQVRDAHHEQLKDATAEERLRFYQEKARRLHEELGLPPVGTGLAAARAQDN
jgi:O-acetyl-ADP-ribose deacetylase (regulator of RNase III)